MTFVSGSYPFGGVKPIHFDMTQSNEVTSMEACMYPWPLEERGSPSVIKASLSAVSEQTCVQRVHLAHLLERDFTFFFPCFFW